MNKQLLKNFQCRLEYAVSTLRINKAVKIKIYLTIMEDIKELEIIPLLLEDAHFTIDQDKQINVSVGARDYRFDPAGTLVFLGMYSLSINKERHPLEEKIYKEIEELRGANKGISSIMEEVAQKNNLSEIHVQLIYFKYKQRNKLV